MSYMERWQIEYGSEDVRHVTTTCPFCGDEKTFDISKDEFVKILAGARIQDVLRHFNADDLERLITGTCEPCWDDIMGGDDVA